MSLGVSLYVEVDTGGSEPYMVYLYDANVTHNMGKMAGEAGLYRHVWEPDCREDVNCAGDLIEPLRDGIKRLEDDPKRFKAFNPANGWGSYDSFLKWLRAYLAACVEHPKAKILVSR